MLTNVAFYLPLLIALSSTPVTAHDIYSNLVDERGASCCSEHDCMPAPFRVTPGGVRMLVKGRWITVPDSKVQYRTLLGDTGETGGGHWCGWDYTADANEEYDTGHTQCAILPPSFSAVVDRYKVRVRARTRGRLEAAL